MICGVGAVIVVGVWMGTGAEVFGVGCRLAFDRSYLTGGQEEFLRLRY